MQIMSYLSRVCNAAGMATIQGHPEHHSSKRDKKEAMHIYILL